MKWVTHKVNDLHISSELTYLFVYVWPYQMDIELEINNGITELIGFKILNLF